MWKNDDGHDAETDVCEIPPFEETLEAPDVRLSKLESHIVKSQADKPLQKKITDFPIK